jgi:hypothetical protein
MLLRYMGVAASTFLSRSWRFLDERLRGLVGVEHLGSPEDRIVGQERKQPVAAGVVGNLRLPALPGEPDAWLEAAPPAGVFPGPAPLFLGEHRVLDGHHLVRHPPRGTHRRQDALDSRGGRRRGADAGARPVELGR